MQASKCTSVKLRDAIEATLAKINAQSDEACSSAQEAALAAKQKIENGQARALARLKEALNSYL